MKLAQTDLHSHTTASDGTFSPSQLIRLAGEIGLSSLAVTDHDTLNGLPEAIQTGREIGIPVIPGVEISTMAEGRNVHLVGLFIDPADSFLQNVLQEMRQRRKERNQAMLEKLRLAGLPVSPEDFPPDLPMLTKTHIGALLTEKGMAASPMEAIRNYLLPGGVGFVPKSHLSPQTCAEAIRHAGGAVIVAHINQISSDPAEALRIARGLLQSGAADGIETLYCQYNDFWREQTALLTKETGCLSSGGSDFHGAMKPGLHLGTGYGDLFVPQLYADSIQTFCQNRNVFRNSADASVFSR